MSVVVDAASDDRRLVLYPGDPGFAPASLPPFVEALRRRGLLGERWRDDRYRVGPRFMQEIVFVGCSPFLRVEPREDRRFCHVQIGCTARPRFLIGADAGPPRCPDCRATLESGADGHEGHCDACQRSVAAEKALWRPGRTAHARLLLSLWTLQKGDAHPTDELLRFLGELGGGPWRAAFL